jgi:hypothetical protein
MPKSTAKAFDQALIKLFKARTHGLRAEVWPSKGAAPKLTQTKIRSSIDRLQNIAEGALLRTKHTQEILRGADHKRQWHPKKGKGHGVDAKKWAFKRWYEENIETRNCIYVFWRGNDCLYVGRTLNGKGRPSSHFEKRWFGKTTRIDIFGFERKRDVPRFECMFTHKHRPSYSKITPAKKKYYTHCPVCAVRRQIHDEIKTVFRLK